MSWRELDPNAELLKTRFVFQHKLEIGRFDPIAFESYLYVLSDLIIFSLCV